MAPDPRAVRTRARLIDGAGKAVARQGFRAVTVEDIVRAAGVSRRTFYQYFGDKDDVLSHLYDGVVTDLLDSVRAAVQSTEGFGGIAARAIDGSTNGVYNQGSVTHI